MPPKESRSTLASLVNAPRPGSTLLSFGGTKNGLLFGEARNIMWPGFVRRMIDDRLAEQQTVLGATEGEQVDSGLGAFTSEAGVDLLSFGGTKNGLLFGEAVVVMRPDESQAAAALPFLRKLNMQLASKMRFVSAQLIALLDGDLWLRSAQHSNAMAARLAEGVQGLDGVKITQPVQANAVFAVLDPTIANRLREVFRFYDWNPATGEVRWMCAFDTTEADVDAFVAELKRLLAEG